MKHSVIGILLIIILLINIVAFIMYGIDKQRAIRNKWRIKEATLIGMAFCFGGAGAFLGMQIFRHKTKHIKFVILVPVALFLEIIILAMLLRRFW